MAATGSDLSSERDRLRAEVERLETKARQLELVWSEFEHDCRRVRDALERSGGRDGELEQRLRSLGANLRLTEQDTARNAKALQDLERRLARVEAEIGRAGPS